VTPRTYCRVYHEIVDDPKFRRVYHDDAALGTWLRMLLIADQMYPNTAPMPDLTPSVSLLLRAGRNAAAVRWQSGSNASKAEHSKAEQEQGIWNGKGRHEGQHTDCLICASMRKGA
jgi:hypothetical protein